MRRVIQICDVHHAFKTDDFGKGAINDPDHIKGAAYTNDGGRSLNLKVFLFEFHQVLGKYFELTCQQAKFGVSFLSFRVKFKFIQMEIRFFSHGHKAAVSER